MSVKFKITMTEKAMFHFMIHHAYTHLTGMIGVLAAILFLAAGVRRMMLGDNGGFVLYLLIAVLFLVHLPISIWTKAKKQIKSTPMFQKPIFYEMLEEGVRVSQDGQSVLNPWSDFQKAISTGQSLILYVSRTRAIILPKDQLKGSYIHAVKMISTHMEPSKVKIKGV